MSCEQVFFKKLGERGFRLTPQREMILSIMHQIEGFATAEEIFARVQTLCSSVDISTVYRTLDLLQDFHMVACVDPADGQRLYELLSIHGPHLNLVCRSCGKIVEADIDLARPLAVYLQEDYDFQADLNHLAIPGLCLECQAARNGDKAAG